MWTYFSISASAWGQARTKLGGVDTSILHHAFMSIFIALWAVITHYISILMAILSYFTRFTMKRGNAGSWNSGWKRSKHWKPILHSSKSPETPRKSFLELMIIIERKKYQRGPKPWPRGWGARPPLQGAPPASGPPGGPPVLIRLQRIYNFWLFHAIILPVLDVYGLYFTLLYHFWD